MATVTILLAAVALSACQVPTPALGIGSTLVREKDGMEMVYVPGGTFDMGSTDGDDNEQPVQTVTLDSFWIDRTEVTNAQYARCVADGICSPPSRSDSWTRDSYYGDSQFDDYPVIYVSWYDADTYCQWAGGRLPTEAEWEYATRGPDSDLYPWGNDPPDDTLANYDKNVGDTTKVGSYPGGASWLGALDMAGNVWEWVQSEYQPYPYRVDDGRENLDSTNVRVLRGGSWYYYVQIVRATTRYYFQPGGRYSYFGFRCVVEPGN
jgi:serine/threonine-protein kinase